MRTAALTLFCALGALAYGLYTRPHSASVRLFAFERRFTTKAEAADFAASVVSSNSLSQLRAKLPSGIANLDLSERCKVVIEPGQSIISISVTAPNREDARTLAEVFGDHVAAGADRWVAQRAAELERQISSAQSRLTELRGRIAETVPSQRTELSTQPEGSASPEMLALRGVQQELAQALTRFTEEHPRVKELRASIAALQRELAQQTKPVVAKAPSQTPAQATERSDIESTMLKAEFAALTTYRDQLVQNRVVTGSKDSEKWRRADQVVLARVTDAKRLMSYYALGALGGLALSAIGRGLRRPQRTIVDRESLEQASQLPVLTVLPNLDGMTSAARDYWAVETLNTVRNAARADRRGCFVCGVVSAGNREGRTTFIDLLAQAGVRTGNRVLVIPAPDSAGAANSIVVPPPAKDAISVARPTLMLEPGNNSLPVHWERAFQTWKHEENALVLVELPPATTADALVYSTGVPNVLWLGAANVADTEVTARCVNSLRNSGCHLIGAALNMCSSIQKRAAAWAVLTLTCLLSGSAVAQEASAPPTNGISTTKAPMLAPWQEKLTVGPGDVFDISLYGQKDSARQVVIGPDGRFSYLQAMDVVATGLTVDELRTKLEQTLMKYHLAPRVVVAPLAFRSKKYYVLGNVMGRGAYPLDKPTTIVEAVARAKGFITASPGRSSFTLTDFSQAFLMRRRADGTFGREPVDFESLFQRGELQHNRTLAPDDYLYFPPTTVDEVYVLGEIRGTGPVTFTKDLTVIGAIASRGGFTDAAFREKILVVRGSLNKPETFVLDMGKVLRGVKTDFVLQPKDIVYVSRKPWAKAEELLEAASSDFMRAIAVTWTGQQIGPITK